MPNGTVTSPGLGAFSYAYGTAVPIMAVANNFYHFAGWTGTAVDDGMVANPTLASTTITVSSDCTLAATFEINPLDPVVNVTLENNPGWSTSGQWGFGHPTGQGGAHYGYPDPTNGYTGANVYGVNLNGDYSTTIGGPYYLVAGPFNLTGRWQTQLEFASWLNADIGIYVTHTLQISVDGGNSWTTLWQQGGTEELLANSWSIESYDIATYADNKTNVYVKWGYSVIASRAYSYSGWNIDDIKIKGRLK
jgi:hypothetical protein